MKMCAHHTTYICTFTPLRRRCVRRKTRITVRPNCRDDAHARRVCGKGDRQSYNIVYNPIRKDRRDAGSCAKNGPSLGKIAGYVPPPPPRARALLNAVVTKNYAGNYSSFNCANFQFTVAAIPFAHEAPSQARRAFLSIALSAFNVISRGAPYDT